MIFTLKFLTYRDMLLRCDVNAFDQAVNQLCRQRPILADAPRVSPDGLNLLDLRFKGCKSLFKLFQVLAELGKLGVIPFPQGKVIVLADDAQGQVFIEAAAEITQEL